MFHFSGIRNYHQQLHSGEILCTDVVGYYLDRIRDHSRLNAFLELFEEEAMEKATALDKLRAEGVPMKKLHGVVIAIKDVFCYRNHKVSAASAMLEGFSSLYTASAIQYLLDEEAIIIGRCNCDEFAMGSSNENSAFGPVRNAANPDYVPGGSSGGNAVAVQAGLCMAGIGTDTGGSVRQPADFCGIIGFKPGYGSVSRYGMVAYASSFDQAGVMTRFLEDAALIASVISKPDSFDSTMDPGQFETPEPAEEKKESCRFCYFRQMLENPSLDPEIKSALLRKIDNLRKAGYTVEEREFALLDYLVPAYYLLTTAEASSNLSRYDGIRYGHQEDPENDLDLFYASNRSAGFGKEVKRRIMLGTFVLSSGYYDAYYAKAQKVRRILWEKTREIFSDYDGILLPVSPGTAFRLGEKQQDPISMYLADIYTVFANLTGIPALAIPLQVHSNGLPFGMQIMAGKGKEKVLFEMGSLIMDL